MIYALIIDHDPCRACPADSLVLGRSLAAYPLMAAKSSSSVSRIYVVTDAPPIKAVALQYNAIIVDPPKEEGDPDLIGRVQRGWQFMKEDLKEDKPPELIAVMFTHAAALKPDSVDEAIDLLHGDAKLDAAVTVTRPDWCSPEFALKETSEDRLALMGLPPGPAWFPDLALMMVRPAALDAMAGKPPFPWLNGNIAALKREGSCVVDHDWQLPQLEHWLKKNGYSDISTALEPQPMPKPQPKQRPDRR